MQGDWERIPSRAVVKSPNSLGPNSVDRHTFMLKFCFIGQRVSYYMDVMSKIGQQLCDTIDIVGESSIKVSLGNVFRGGEGNPQFIWPHATDLALPSFSIAHGCSESNDVDVAG